MTKTALIQEFRGKVARAQEYVSKYAQQLVDGPATFSRIDEMIEMQGTINVYTEIADRLEAGKTFVEEVTYWTSIVIQKASQLRSDQRSSHRVEMMEVKAMAEFVRDAEFAPDITEEDES